MDLEDVSSVRQWMDMLVRQKAALHDADERRGEQPKDRKRLDQLVNRHMASYASTAMMKLQHEHMIYHSFVAAPYLPSVAPFHKLKKIYIKDLMLQTHHMGKYILLRVATPAVSMTAIMAILEDENGDGVVLQLYQQEDQHDRAAEDIVELHSVCVLKEPYFKVMNDGGTYHVGMKDFNDQSKGLLPKHWHLIVF